MSRRASKVSKNKKYVCIISQNTRELKPNEIIKELCTITKKRSIFAVYLQETWQNGISTLEDKNCVIFSNGLDPNNVKSCCGEHGIEILLNENAATAWRYEGSNMSITTSELEL